MKRGVMCRRNTFDYQILRGGVHVHIYENSQKCWEVKRNNKEIIK
jgi:hypothetical protein